MPGNGHPYPPLFKKSNSLSIKKDGREEEFIKEKIVISLIKSGSPPEIGRAIADEVEKITEEQIKTQVIRKIVLEKLKKRDVDWYKSWVSYDESTKRLSKYDG